MLEVSRQDARSVVADGYPSGARAIDGAGTDSDMRGLRGVLGRVGDEVVEDALDQPGVGLDEQPVVHRDRDLPSAEERGQPVDRTTHQLAKVEGLDAHVETTGFELR